MISTYLIKSLSDDFYYTGISENPHKRLKEHNSGKLSTTSGHKPFMLVYIKNHLNYSEAREHEKWLKKKSIDYKSKLYLSA